MHASGRAPGRRLSAFARSILDATFGVSPRTSASNCNRPGWGSLSSGSQRDETCRTLYLSHRHGCGVNLHSPYTRHDRHPTGFTPSFSTPHLASSRQAASRRGVHVVRNAVRFHSRGRIEPQPRLQEDESDAHGRFPDLHAAYCTWLRASRREAECQPDSSTPFDTNPDKKRG